MSQKRTPESLLPPPWILTIAVCVGVVWLISELREIVVLLVVGYSIAYVIDPILDRLERRKISRPLGVIVLSVIALAFLAVLALTALPTLADQYRHLVEQLPDQVVRLRQLAFDSVQALIAYLPESMRASIDQQTIMQALPTPDSAMVQKVVGTLASALLSGYSIALTLISLTLLPFIVFYLAVDFDRFHQWILSILPLRSRKKISKIAAEINQYVSAFVRGQLIICSILFVLYALGLGFVGVKLWFLLAVLSGFGQIVPYLGFLIGIVLSSIMALATFGDFSHLLLVWGVYGVVQALEGFLITPRVLGESVGLSPLLVIIALFAGGQLFGLLGIFLAIPAAAAIRVLLRHAHALMLSRVAAHS